MHRALPAGVIAVVRTATAEHALTVARGLSRSRVAAIEVTLTVPDAVAVLAQLVAEGVQRVGAGTVRTVEQVEACAGAGAAFVVSPHTEPRVIRAAVELGLAVVPGALTPSEITRAMSVGASAVKIFPVGAVGGVAYVRAVREPLPDIPLIVSGGIHPADVRRYLAAGALAVCLGASLWRRDDVLAGDVAAVHAYAEHVPEISDMVA